MKAKVIFTKIGQAAHVIGNTEDCTVARVYFDLVIDGRKYAGPDLFANIKQTLGTLYRSAPLEVGSPKGYPGPFNHAAFRREAESYYRVSFMRAFGPAAGSNMQYHKNVLATFEKTVEFDIPGKEAG